MTSATLLWPPSRLVRRAVELARSGGVRALWFGLLAQTFYRRLVLIDRALDTDAPTVATGVAVTFEPLAATQIDEYIRFRREDPEEARRRLDAGHWCFVGRHSGAIVNVVWVATGTTWIDYLGCSLPLAADEVYQYESFTAPEFRRQGIVVARGVYVYAFLRARGYRRSVAAILPENTPAFGPVRRLGYQRLGYQRIGWIGVVRLGPWRWIIGTAPRAAARASGSRATSRGAVTD